MVVLMLVAGVGAGCGCPAWKSGLEVGVEGGVEFGAGAGIDLPNPVPRPHLWCVHVGIRGCATAVALALVARHLLAFVGFFSRVCGVGRLWVW